ncbi:MAG: Rieske 2Fe-2S domain-containing protein [Paludibacteraceae bacterium]|nr:Rieske 2Fe-2S domain-containing protein [Paludibacteraceae bacterium]
MKAIINKKSILALTFLMLLGACKDSNTSSSVPSSAVYIYQDINLYSMVLRAIGGYKTYTAVNTSQGVNAIGYGGVLIFYGYDENYYAFDMSCPHEASRTIRVMPNDQGQAVCSTCGSVFNIGYGSGNVVSGPATEGLRKFKVTATSTTTGLYIYVVN